VSINGVGSQRCVLDVLRLGNYVTEVDPGAELNAILRRGARVALGHPPLHLDRTAHGIHHAGELRQEPVAGILDLSTPII